ncbi:AIPR protein [Pseudovibrio sp. Ad37]|nr:AIPR protein [Pseudovibrio sp. Ad37]
MVAGEEVSNWWTTTGKRLFAQNIRQMLGSTEVNEEIRNTLETSPDKFWYFNNGITIVADTIRKSAVGGNSRELGSFKAANISIVNGAQTVSTIGRFAANEFNNLEDIKVPVRLISLEGAEDGFGGNVTKTNNRQNRIENRDFVSQDPEQIRIRKELLIEDIDYNIITL